MPGYALVRLKEKYESGLSTEKEKYAERTEGTLVDFIYVNESSGVDYEALDGLVDCYRLAKGSVVYFAPFTDGEPVKHEGAEYVFLPIKEIRGVKKNA